MRIEKCILGPFTVIGKEGSTNDGEGFIPRLWAEANASFPQVQHLAKRDASGRLAGFWGAMSDFSRSFQPWQENFTRGLYLAGVECADDAEAPEGWVKWVIPAFEYLYAECDGGDTFANVLACMAEQHLPLAGAVHDFTCPETGRNYMFFPIRRL